MRLLENTVGVVLPTLREIQVSAYVATERMYRMHSDECCMLL